MADKPRARRTPKTASPVASLIDALKFIAPAQAKAGPPNVQFCDMYNGMLTASNGILTIGVKIEEKLDACVNTLQFLDALTKCKAEVQIAQVTQQALSVKSGDFQALIPCIDPATLQIGPPDARIAFASPAVVEALDCVQGLATDGATYAHKAGVLLQGGSCVATDGFAMLECWHGVDLPPDLILPRKSVQAIVKANKIVTGFGYSSNSVTFWYGEDAFIKTQLFNERYPNYNLVLDAESKPFPIPSAFWEAVEAVHSFSPDGTVYFVDGQVCSSLEKTMASTYKVEGLAESMAFNSKMLLPLKHAFERADFQPQSNKVYFFGEKVRGVLMALDLKKAPPVGERGANFEDGGPFGHHNYQSNIDDNDDIPF